MQPPRKKLKRSFDFIAPEIQPKPQKKLTISETLLSNDDPARLFIPERVSSYKNINFSWMLSHHLNIPNTPMWVGFNNKIFDDNLPKQMISYLSTINESPTKQYIVEHTMERTLIAADECGQKNIQVTYDLAIAKVALQIQSNQKERFQRLFIHFGPFHIFLALFKAIGKFIDDSGICSLMSMAELLAAGSVNGFILGKHYNRCKRLHPIVSLAIQILHFQSFLKKKQKRKKKN